MLDRFGDAGDEVPVGKAGVRLRRRPSVHGNRRRAGVRDALCQLGRVLLVIVPPRTHLHRHRDLHGLRHRRDHRLRVRGLAHQAAPGAVLRDLRHRAAHVHVDDVGAELLDHLRGIGHLLRIAAEDLDRDGPLLLGVLRVLERPVDPAHQALGAHHLGDHQAAPAVPFHQAAKRRVRHARHGRDGERRPQLDVSNLHKLPIPVATSLGTSHF